MVNMGSIHCLLRVELGNRRILQEVCQRPDRGTVVGSGNQYPKLGRRTGIVLNQNSVVTGLKARNSIVREIPAG